MDIKDHRILLIGGTSGIGKAVAQAAAEEGARVIVASRSKDAIDATLSALPDSAEGHQLDVADEDAVLALFDRIGEFDHLVYTAGEHIFMRPVANVPPADARGCFDTRFFGAFAAARHALPRLRPGGSIVLTSGVIAVRPAPNTAIPAAVSGAVEALVRALAVEAAPIRVNAVRLGPVPTDLTGANRGEIPEREKIFREVSAKLLTRRMGRAEEAAAAYLHLMKNTFTTGVILPTDGGFVLV